MQEEHGGTCFPCEVQLQNLTQTANGVNVKYARVKIHVNEYPVYIEAPAAYLHEDDTSCYAGPGWEWPEDHPSRGKHLTIVKD